MCALQFLLHLTLIISSILLLCEISVNGLQCKDEDNNSVDWYIMYKIPRIKKCAPSQLIRNGFAYLFVTSNHPERWVLSGVNIMDNKSMLSLTLEPIYQSGANASIAHLFYNDEKPHGGNKGTKGHTKGVLAADKDNGLWLIHSVPLFPPKTNEGYSFPLSGTIYGQSFICITFDRANMNDAALQLFYDQPQVYSSSLPNDLMLWYPNIQRIIDHEAIDSPPWFRVEVLKSLSGQEFVSFAKTRDFSKDLYGDLVAPGLKSSLLVETWLNGPGKLSSNCTVKFSVVNVREVSLKLANVSFDSSLDHSKWAVSTENDWTCIGDINRAEHQKKRGGGTICLSNADIAKFYRESAVELEKCI